MASPSLAFSLRPLKSIFPYAGNPRKIPKKAIAAVAGSIKAFGFKQPIVVDKKGVIVAGHTRYLAAKSLKLIKVPVIVADDLSKDQIRAYRIADNRVAEFSDWDIVALQGELDELTGVDLEFAQLDALVKQLGGGIPDEDIADVNQIEAKFLIIVECKDEAHQQKCYDTLMAKGMKCKLSNI